MPSPTIEKRSSSADEAQYRCNTTEDRILTHARDGIDPGREFDTHPMEYFRKHHDDQLDLTLSPKLQHTSDGPFFERPETLLPKEDRRVLGLGIIPDLQTATTYLETLAIEGAKEVKRPKPEPTVDYP